MNVKAALGITFFIVSFTGLGWMMHDGYDYYNYHRTVNGFYAEKVDSSKLLDYQDVKDKYGDWVCINVRDMDYDTAYDTCVHECSHRAYSEIFAEYCENDGFKQCKEVIQNEK